MECHRAAPIPERSKISSPEMARVPEAEVGRGRARECHFVSCRREHALEKQLQVSWRGLTLRPVAPPCSWVVSGSLEDGFDTEG